MKFGDFLKIKREEAGILQCDLADRIGIPRSSMSYIEMGKYIPNRDVIEKLGKELGEKEMFFYLAGKIPKDEDTCEKLFKLIRKDGK